MNRKLFVGNLPFTLTEQDLRDTFSEVGTVVSARVMTDKETGRARGFGFVEMASDAEAAEAIARFDQFSLSGRQINVSIARPQAPRTGGGEDHDRRHDRNRGSRDSSRDSRW